MIELYNFVGHPYLGGGLCLFCRIVAENKVF